MTQSAGPYAINSHTGVAFAMVSGRRSPAVFLGTSTLTRGAGMFRCARDRKAGGTTAKPLKIPNSWLAVSGMTPPLPSKAWVGAQFAGGDHAMIALLGRHTLIWGAGAFAISKNMRGASITPVVSPTATWAAVAGLVGARPARTRVDVGVSGARQIFWSQSTNYSFWG